MTNGLLTGEFDLVVGPPTEDLARIEETDKDAELQAAFTRVTEVFEPEERVDAMRELNRILEFEHFGDGKPHFGQANVRWLAQDD